MRQAIEHFNHKKGKFCFLSNIGEYLGYYNLGCTEAWLGGVLGYFGFIFTPGHIESGEVLLGRNASFETMFERFFDKLGHKLIKAEFKKGEEGLNFAAGLLVKEIPIMIWINDYYLDYSPYYQKAEYWSIAVLLEINNDTLTLYDNQIRNIKTETFFKAIKNNKPVRIYYTDDETLTWKEREPANISSGLKTAVDIMEAGGLNGAQYNGFDGIKSFAKVLSDCVCQDQIFNYSYQMNRASGPPVTRESMYNLLKELETKAPGIEVFECAELYMELSEKWRKIGNLLFKLSVSVDSELKGRIVERIYKVAELERKGLEMLKSSLIPQIDQYFI